jgi:uncharacterized protein
MFQLFRKMMPREDKFFDMFERHALCLTNGAGVLRKLLDGGPDVPQLCKELMAEEDKADHICIEVLEGLRRSFITPFDRSDIKSLIDSMDDAIDQMNKTAKSVILYDVKEFEREMRTMGDGIVRAASLTAEAMPLLRAIGTNSTRLHEIAREVISIEDESDRMQEEGLKKLVIAGRKDPMDFIIGSEIYEHLEKVADRLEDVANNVSDLVIEHV